MPTNIGIAFAMFAFSSKSEFRKATLVSPWRRSIKVNIESYCDVTHELYRGYLSLEAKVDDDKIIVATLAENLISTSLSQNIVKSELALLRKSVSILRADVQSNFSNASSARPEINIFNRPWLQLWAS